MPVVDAKPVVDPVVARKTWRTLEPVHGVVYFAPEPAEEYERAGLAPGRMGYFASRAAPMGTPPAETVIATFFNFNPAVIREVVQGTRLAASGAGGAGSARRATTAARATGSRHVDTRMRAVTPGDVTGRRG